MTLFQAFHNKAPLAKLRILVLTDGLDNKSSCTRTDVIAFCRENNIVIDGVSVGELSKVFSFSFLHPDSLSFFKL
jgi:hypothetical protein